MMNFKKVLLWLAVLPGSLMAGLASNFILHFVLYLTLRNFIDPYPELPERILTPFFFSLSFICLGAYIAPTYKLGTAVILFSLFIFFTGGFAFLNWIDSPYFGKQLSFHGGGTATVLGVVGALIGLYICYARYPQSASKEVNEGFIVPSTIDKAEDNYYKEPSKKICILHLDDHQVYLDGMKKVVNAYYPEFEFISFTDPAAAIEYLQLKGEQGANIDCIITDYNHPGKNGYQFAKEIKDLTTPFASRVPIILLSMVCGLKGMEADLQQWKEEKVFAMCLPKSANSEAIIKAVLKVTRNN